MPSTLAQAQLSQAGSGSSCRSFYAPWALWQEDLVESIELPTAIYCIRSSLSVMKKKVSSSEAHKRVKTSPFFILHVINGQIDNLKTLLQALDKQDWQTSHDICWREFQDMHQLFSTCSHPFSYITPDTEKVLKMLQDFSGAMSMTAPLSPWMQAPIFICFTAALRQRARNNLNVTVWLAITMFCDFETTTHGKWILAGEHAVLRGFSALVFPVYENLP